VINITHSLVSSQSSYEYCLNVESVMDVTDEGNCVGLEIHCVVENRQTKGPSILDVEDLRHMGYIHTVKHFSR